MDRRRNCHFQDVTDSACVSSWGRWKRWIWSAIDWSLLRAEMVGNKHMHARTDKTAGEGTGGMSHSERSTHANRQTNPIKRPFIKREVQPSKWAHLWAHYRPSLFTSFLPHFKNALRCCSECQVWAIIFTHKAVILKSLPTCSFFVTYFIPLLLLLPF